jgi:alkaline phosphatase
VLPGRHTISATVSDATGAASASATFAVESAGAEDEGGRTRNVIILLGDGMGVAHRTAARLVRFGATAGDPNDFLEMDKFPGTGLVSTHSLNSIVTDSAPGMACYTTGNHAQNGQEGVYPANVTSPFYQPRVEYMSEYLHRVKGSSTGIVTTADVEDATPAANAVHTGDRNKGQGIVDQYLDESGNTGLAVLMGGGRRWFLPSSQYGSSRSTNNDYSNLPSDLVSAWNIPTPGAIDPSTPTPRRRCLAPWLARPGSCSGSSATAT